MVSEEFYFKSEPSKTLLKGPDWGWEDLPTQAPHLCSLQFSLSISIRKVTSRIPTTPIVCLLSSLARCTSTILASHAPSMTTDMLFWGLVICSVIMAISMFIACICGAMDSMEKETELVKYRKMKHNNADGGGNLVLWVRDGGNVASTAPTANIIGSAVKPSYAGSGHHHHCGDNGGGNQNRAGWGCDGGCGGGR